MQVFPGEDDNIDFKRSQEGGKEWPRQGSTYVDEKGYGRAPENFGCKSAREEVFVALFGRITDESNMDL